MWDEVMKGGDTATEETEQTWPERQQQRHQAITNIRFGSCGWVNGWRNWIETSSVRRYSVNLPKCTYIKLFCYIMLQGTETLNYAM